MVETATFNPLNAGDPKKLPRRSYARCVVNETGDMPLTLKEASKIPANVEVPFWTVEYEALDAQFPDGNAAMRRFGSRLVDKNGDILDNTQRPAVNAQAFAGLGIVAFPDDPSYDESRVIGNVFELEAVDFPTGKPVWVPVAEMGPDFVFEGEVYVIPVSGGGASATPAVTGTQTTTEILGDAALEAELTEILENAGGTDKATVRQALTDAGFGQGLTLNGNGVVGLAISGKLVEEAEAAGLI